jgi:hypothetical protein
MAGVLVLLAAVLAIPACGSAPLAQAQSARGRDGDLFQETTLVAPRTVLCGEPVTWRIAFRVGGTRLPAGTRVLLRFPHAYYTLRGMGAPDRPGGVPPGRLEEPRSTPRGLPLRLEITAPPAGPGAGEEGLLATVLSPGIPPGSTFELSFLARAPRAAVTAFPLLVLGAGPGETEFRELARPTVAVNPREAVDLVLTIPSLARPGEWLPLRVRGRDRLGNLLAAPGIPYTIEGVVRGDPESGELSVQAPGSGVLRVVARERGGGRSWRSNPCLIGEEPGPAMILWGDLHGHTAASDGLGDLAAYRAFAGGPADLDFLAVSDHGWQLDSAAWERLRRESRRQDAGGPIFLAGWEYDMCGHRNVYYPGDPGSMRFESARPRELWEIGLNRVLTPAPPRGRCRRWDPLGLFAALQGRRALVIPHTPASRSMGRPWDYHDDRYERLVEIYSAHGSSMAPGSPRALGDFDPRGAVSEALRRGFHLGFVAAGDSHDGHPGATLWGPYPGGLTAVLTEERSRESLFAALYARRCYATTGARIAMILEIEGLPMGGAGRAEGFLNVRARLAGTAPFSEVALLCNGEVLQRFPPRGEELAIETTLPAPSQTAFYYLRAVQEDGETAWSSPIAVAPPGAGVLQSFHAEEAPEGIALVWKLDPGESFRGVRILRRRGNDGGGRVALFEELTPAPDPRPAGRLVDRDASPGIPCFYILELLGEQGVTRRCGPLAHIRSDPEPAAIFAVDGPRRRPLRFAVPEPAEVTVEILALDRRQVVRRLDLGRLPAGIHSVEWDGRDDRGRPVPRTHILEPFRDRGRLGIHYWRTRIGGIPSPLSLILVAGDPGA